MELVLLWSHNYNIIVIVCQLCLNCYKLKILIIYWHVHASVAVLASLVENPPHSNTVGNQGTSHWAYKNICMCESTSVYACVCEDQRAEYFSIAI